MTENTVVWLNYYFELLREVNKQLIKCVGMDCINNYINIRQEFCELIQKILVITPCTKNKVTDEIEIATNDGVFTFCDELDFLKDDIRNVIDSHEKTYRKMKEIRNKYEHELHFVNFYGSSSGLDQLTNLKLKYENKKETRDEIDITSEELIGVIKDINVLFDKIMEKTLDFIEKCDDEDFKYVYASKYYRIQFSNYNEIYDSNLLLKISRAMN